jgi:hypothetical protein
MLMKMMVALSAALVLAAAAPAMAKSAKHRHPGPVASGYAFVPHAPRPFTYAEKLWLDRASRPSNL